MSNAAKKIPEGYMQDQQGKLVPHDLVRPIDIERNDMVLELVELAKVKSIELADFKQHAMSAIEKFVNLSGRKYQVKMGGNKGNVTLMSYDGRFKIQRAIGEHLVFDERLQVAKELIDQCLNDWSQGSRPEIKVLINDAFQVDKTGKVSTARIFGLQRLDIKDRKWKKAMKAISDSVQVAGSKSYVRIYERVGDTDEYKPIPLDVAAL